VHYLIALSLQSLERNLEQACRHYDRALALGFDEFWVRVNRGRLLYTLGDDLSGDQDVKIAGSLNTGDLAAMSYRETARLTPLWRDLKAGAFGAVVKRGRELLQQQSGELHYLLGLCLDEVGELTESLQHLNQALAFGFDEFWVRFHLGRLLHSAGDASRARREFARAAELGAPDSAAEEMLQSALAQVTMH
jgi:tetratricopeptide (TPR) repeat protein